MPILIVGIAQTKAFVLDLATPAASKRHKGRIATNPLLTTRRFHQRRLGIATEAAMLAGNRLGFHAVVSHRIALSAGGGCRHRTRSFAGVHHAADRSILMGSSSSNPRRPPCRLRPWGLTRARVMSQLSKVKHSRHQWKHKAKQRGDHDRYQRKQIARLNAERDQATQALKETQARLRQLESPAQRTRRPAQGGRGLLGPATLFGGPHRLSRRLVVS